MSKHTPEPWKINRRDSWWDGNPYYKDGLVAIEGLCSLPDSHPSEGWEVVLIHDCRDPDIDSDPSRPDDLDRFIRELQLANAARIVACVNALAGIPDPAVFVNAARELARAARSVWMWESDDCSGEEFGGARPDLVGLSANAVSVQLRKEVADAYAAFRAADAPAPAGTGSV